ncbi:MAG: nitrogen regulation protein [Friedmanniella sp.]|nr:nitrogen regulation protein [Friedmanniella sp.]
MTRRPPPAHVLVVDDDTVSRLVLAHMVRRLGHQVSEADTVARAAESVTLSPPDLILSDYCLPDGTGVDVLHAVRGMGVGVPFVLVTGMSEFAEVGDDGGVERGRPGVQAVLTKPIDSRALAHCLSGILARAS